MISAKVRYKKLKTVLGWALWRYLMPDAVSFYALFDLVRIVTIYIGNLSFSATEEDLMEVFTEYGSVRRISLPVDRETGKKRGFAFIEMESEDQEDAAISELDGAEWLGRELRVNKAKPRESRR